MTSYDPLTQVQYDAIVALLDDTDLDHSALVALNLSAPQAESVLSAIRTWQDENAANLAILGAAVDVKKLAVRAVERDIRTGPFNAEHAERLATARQELATARGSYNSALDPLRTLVTAELSGSQRGTWTAIRTGLSDKMPRRMLDLEDAQGVALTDAERVFDCRYAAAGTRENRSTERTSYAERVNEILTVEQEAVRDGHRNNFATASANVVAAFELVLPVGQG
jgi:hypothetical protein